MTTLSQFFPSGSSAGGGGGIPATTTVAELLIVGGGSSGSLYSPSNSPGKGGNGGGVLESLGWHFEQGCPYTVTVGSGGATPPTGGSNPGTNSSIIGYNAPPSTLIGEGGFTVKQTDPGGSYDCVWMRRYFTRNRQISANTYHYGTESGCDSMVYLCTPICCRIMSGAAGGASNPGCPLQLEMIPRGCTSNGLCMISYNIRPGGEGYMSNISGTDTYYGPGGHGGNNLMAEAKLAPIDPYVTTMRQGWRANQGGYNCCEIWRPATSFSGCQHCGPGAGCRWVGASANYGAGGSGLAGPSAPSCIPCGNGGSGVVFIRYPDQYPAATAITGCTPTPAQPGYHVYRFNGTGSITF